MAKYYIGHGEMSRKATGYSLVAEASAKRELMQFLNNRLQYPYKDGGKCKLLFTQKRLFIFDHLALKRGLKSFEMVKDER